MGTPFTPTAHGGLPPSLADSPPVEFGIFDLVLHVRDSPTTLRVLFAIADFATLLLIGLGTRRTKVWRLDDALSLTSSSLHACTQSEVRSKAAI